MRAFVLCLLSLALTACGDPDEDPPPTARPFDCGAPEPFSVELSTTHHEMCVGSEQRLSARVEWSCEKRPTTSGAVFSSSDPVVIAIDGDRAVARAPGAAEIKATAEGLESARRLVRVMRCADSGVTD